MANYGNVKKDIEVRVQDLKTKQYRNINKKSYELAKHHYRLVKPDEDERSEVEKTTALLDENAQLKAQLAALSKKNGEDERSEEDTEDTEPTTSKKRGRPRKEQEPTQEAQDTTEETEQNENA